MRVSVSVCNRSCVSDVFMRQLSNVAATHPE